MKTAVVFSGQGAQYQGMGLALLEHDVVKATFAEASEVLGYDLIDLIANDEEKLNQTEYTQPAILTVSIAMYRMLQADGIQPDLVAGLSLGEYSALVASGAIDLKSAVELVAKRGKFMAEAAPQGTGKMVAVMNTPRELIESSCQEASAIGIVTPANYNTPKQIVIGGEVAAVDLACDILTKNGAKRLIPLNVSGPFHTALLQPASINLQRELEKLNFSPMQIPLISNTTAEIMQDSEIKDLLTKQVMSSVKWEDSILKMKELGIEHIIEVGPGKVLTGFIKKIDKTISTETFDK